MRSGSTESFAAGALRRVRSMNSQPRRRSVTSCPGRGRGQSFTRLWVRRSSGLISTSISPAPRKSMRPVSGNESDCTPPRPTKMRNPSKLRAASGIWTLSSETTGCSRPMAPILPHPFSSRTAHTQERSLTPKNQESSCGAVTAPHKSQRPTRVNQRPTRKNRRPTRKNQEHLCGAATAPHKCQQARARQPEADAQKPEAHAQRPGVFVRRSHCAAQKLGAPRAKCQRPMRKDQRPTRKNQEPLCGAATAPHKIQRAVGVALLRTEG